MKNEVRNIIIDALKKIDVLCSVDFNIDEPPSADMGDWSTNVALVVASQKKQNAKDIALLLKDNIEQKEEIAEVKIAGAGFINFKFKPEFYYSILKKAYIQKDNFGRNNSGRGKKISIDYVSANPTGPLHIGNARGGPIGETLARLLEFCGYSISRDFYLNDTGVQTKRLGETLYYYMEKNAGKDIDFPDDGYQGSYVEILYKDIEKKHSKELNKINDKEEIVEYLRLKGLKLITKRIESDLKKIQIKYDNYYSQTQIQESGKTSEIIKRLQDNKAVISREGAVWFKSDNDEKSVDKESVLRKSEDNSYTYFADDLAFHMKRYDDGIFKIINIWGSNHFGHIPRMRSALGVLGIDADRLSVLLYQYVRIKNDQKLLSMSKRKGNMITLKEVLDSGLEPDAFKYFILTQNLNTPIDFDLKLASTKNDKNPVYYIKYAHARICSILKKANGGIGEDEDFYLVLSNDKELMLAKELAKMPDIVEEVSCNYQIQTLPHYAFKIAQLFHDFYSSCQIISKDKKLTISRLNLVKVTKIVLKNVLTLMSIEAPEKM